MSAMLSSVGTVIFGEALILVWMVILGFWWLDRYEEKLLPGAGLIFLWGGCAELIFVLLTKQGTLAALSWAALHRVPWTIRLVPPLLEVLGLLVIVWLGREGDGPVDLFVFGTVMGAGFGGVWLMVQAGLAHVDHIRAGTFGHVAVEVAFGLLWNMLAGGAAGALVGFGRLRASTTRLIAWSVAAFGATTAILIGVPKLPLWLKLPRSSRLSADLVAIAIMIILLVVVLYWVERTSLRLELEEEATLGIIPQWVPQIVPFYTHRIRSGWWPQRSERIVLVRLLSRLAFRKRRLRGHHRGDTDLAGLEVLKIREHLGKILAPADAGEP